MHKIEFVSFSFVRLLNRSRDMLKDIKDNTEIDPGWDERGGLFIARTKVSYRFSIRFYLKFTQKFRSIDSSR